MAETTRRGLLGALATVGAISAVAAGCATDRPDGTAADRWPTFVLVGGNGAPSFFWMPIVRALSLLGHRAHPVELPWHGLDAEFTVAYQAPQDLVALHQQTSGLSRVKLADYAGAIVDVIRKVHAHGPVILVGHSLGGTGITLAANAVPELIDRLVYISAFCCTAREYAWEYMGGPENGDSLGLADSLPANELSTPKTTLVSHTNWRTADREYLDAARRAMMAEATESQFLAAANFCTQPMESAAVSFEDARGRADTWGTVRRSYIRLTADQFNTLPNQNRMIADADATTPGNRFDIYDLDASHLGLVLKADQVATLLDRIGSQTK